MVIRDSEGGVSYSHSPNNNKQNRNVMYVKYKHSIGEFLQKTTKTTNTTADVSPPEILLNSNKSKLRVTNRVEEIL